MILIGDTGATKTDWRLIDGKTVHQFSQGGFNASTHDTNAFVMETRHVFQDRMVDVDQLFFYCAGIIPSNQPEVVKRLSGIFTQAKIAVASDQLGAARSLFGNKPGRVGILGTGSAGVIYDGHQIVQKVPSLGYILGDEGSGAYLGRKLISKYLRGQLSKEVATLFCDQFGVLSEGEIFNHIYTKLSAGYLASFASFLVNHQSDPEVYALVYDGFQDYFDAYWGTVPSDQLSYAFTGSIAHFLSNILRKVGSDRGIHIDIIHASPIAGLTIYHQQS